MKFKLKAPGTKRLRLQCDTVLSTSAFSFNVRRYNSYWLHNATSVPVRYWLAKDTGGGGGGGGEGGEEEAGGGEEEAGAYTRSLQSST
jgi:hypothetical protein